MKTFYFKLGNWIGPADGTPAVVVKINAPTKEIAKKRYCKEYRDAYKYQEEGSPSMIEVTVKEYNSCLFPDERTYER